MRAVAESLGALLENLIDYAGLYPPAALSLPDVLERYEAHRASPHAWMLNRLVLPVARLADARPKDGWRITLLVEGEPGPLPPAVETLETKLPRRLSLPTYCEAPPERIEGAYAKIRTGGLTPDALPSPDAIAGFLAEAAARRIPFKATAGLHHPFRSPRPLTYAADSPRAVMHGFVNVFAAAAFAWHGAEPDALVALLDETEPRSFEFGAAELRWRGLRLSTDQIRAARAAFAHSFGSCSFEEPIADLRDLELLP
ncbi:MAG: hypothetical protein LAQ30_20020 [Acidobacteriia bacterium]|nr:hypothetical protein [Terriglobia bacterium]